MKVAGKTWQRSRRTSPAAGSYIQPWVFKWLSKNQNKSNYSDQSQHEQSAVNQSQFTAITCNSLEAREKSRVHGAIGFGFTSHWLKNWRDSFKPITKRSNRIHVIAFDSHLKSALLLKLDTYRLVWYQIVAFRRGSTVS